MEDFVNKETGEILTPNLPVKFQTSSEAIIINPYQDIAKAPFAEEAQKVLGTNIDENDVEIKPDGIIYLPGVKYRNVLHKAFGRGAWALLPKNTYIDQEANMVFYHGSLFVNSQFVSESIGEQQYHKNNPNMSYATALEGAKTDCLTRCCKDLGIANELWAPQFIRRWKTKYAIEIWCVGAENSNNAGKKKKLWRKKTDPAFEYPWQEQNKQSQKQTEKLKNEKENPIPKTQSPIDGNGKKALGIAASQWTNLCKMSLQAKDPDGKVMGSNILFETAKKMYGVKLGTDLTIQQAEKIEAEYFRAWQNGTWDTITNEVKDAEPIKAS